MWATRLVMPIATSPPFGDTDALSFDPSLVNDQISVQLLTAATRSA